MRHSLRPLVCAPTADSAKIGDGGCGKSSITTRFLRREFSEEWDPTIEDSYQTSLSVDGQEYSIEIVDTAGQEEYRGFGSDQARTADAFVIASVLFVSFHVVFVSP